MEDQFAKYNLHIAREIRLSRARRLGDMLELARMSGFRPDETSGAARDGLLLVMGVDAPLPSTVTYKTPIKQNCMNCGTTIQPGAVVHEDMALICNRCARQFDGVRIHALAYDDQSNLHFRIRRVHDFWHTEQYPFDEFEQPVPQDVSCELHDLMINNLVDNAFVLDSLPCQTDRDIRC